MKAFRNTALILIMLILIAYIVVGYYEYIFSRNVVGVISKVERVNLPVTVMTVNGTQQQNDAQAQMFSFAIGIKDEKTGEINVASSEDRQWAVAQPGQCASAQYFPYPPWNLAKWGTYHNARLEKLSDCSAK